MQRNAAHPFPRSNLAYAYRGAGQFRQARQVVEEAIGRGLETVPMRRLRLSGGGARTRRRHRATADRVGGGETARLRYHGRASPDRGVPRPRRRSGAPLRRDHQGVDRSRFSAGRVRLRGTGCAHRSRVPSYRKEAVARAHEVLRIATAFEPQLKAATALALAGDPDEAETVLRRLRNVRPDDTLLQTAYLPVAEAAVRLARGQAATAVEALRRASQYEFGTVCRALSAVSAWRGTAAAGGRRQAGGRGFRAVTEHRGVDPFSPFVPLSYLRRRPGSRARWRPRRQPQGLRRTAADVGVSRSGSASAPAGAGGARALVRHGHRRTLTRRGTTDEMHDVVVIGAGPVGLACAIAGNAAACRRSSSTKGRSSTRSSGIRLAWSSSPRRS